MRLIASSILVAMLSVPTHAAEIKVETSESLGGYLTDGSGRALYMFKADKRGAGAEDAQSNCYDACADAWPPFTSSNTPQTGQKVKKELVGAIERKDGSQQVTYNGWPLYYFAKDKGAGDTSGQDIEGFGAEWYLVTPAGKEVHAAAAGSNRKSAAD